MGRPRGRITYEKIDHPDPATGALLDLVIEALRVSGVSQTKFGYEAAGDAALVPKMRKGRTIRKQSLRDAIEWKARALLEEALK